MISKEGPGGCRGLECKKFCDSPDNAEACFEFAAKEGLIPQAEIAQARKFMQASKQGGPGGCRGRECQTFCEDPSHQEECFQFAKNQGIIPPEEIQRFEKGNQIRQEVEQNGGPGGCRDENGCRQYCSDPGNTDECVNFAVQKGGFSQEEGRKSLEQFKKFQEFGDKIRQNPDQFIGAEFNPREFEQKFQQQVKDSGPEGFDPNQFKGFGPGQGGFGPPIGGGFGPQGDFGSQGGFDQQGGFGPQGGGFGGGSGGPGGCQGLEECSNFCQDPAHSSECGKFGPPPSAGRENRGNKGGGGQQGDSRSGGFPFPRQGDEFPGQGSEGEGNFPEHESDDRFPGQDRGGFQGGFQPTPEDINRIQEFQAQQQIQNQTRQQFQQEFQQRGGDLLPQTGSFQPQGEFRPQESGGFSPPPSGDGSFSPLPSGGGSFSPQPSGGGGSFSPPPGALAPVAPLGFILSPIFQIFR